MNQSAPRVRKMSNNYKSTTHYGQTGKRALCGKIMTPVLECRTIITSITCRNCRRALCNAKQKTMKQVSSYEEWKHMNGGKNGN